MLLAGAWPVALVAQDEAIPDKVAEVAKKDADLLVAPVPFLNPDTGAGLAAGAVVFYNPNGGAHQWTTGGGGMWTTRGSRGLAAFHSMSSVNDDFRLNALVSWVNGVESYYGIGAEDGDRDDPIRLRDKSLRVKARALWRVVPDAFIGAQYVLAAHDAAQREVDPDDPAEPSLTPPPPVAEMQSTSSMLGPVLILDTRDNHEQPRAGVLVNATWLLGRTALGDDFRHDLFTLKASAYHALGERTVAAARASFCSAGGDPAYYDLCRFGSGGDLRGYPSGRYRDRASWALQGEVRHGFSQRWGGVLFGGVGGIAPSVGDILDDGNLLPSAGIGVRFRPFSDNAVQLRLDVAVGEDARGVYVGIGEAF